LIDEGGHLVGYAVRRVERTQIENGGFDAGMVAPEMLGQCQESGIRALEFVETLHKIAKNDELEGVVHIHRELYNQLKVEKSHVLCFVYNDHVFFGNANARFHFLCQYVADTGVGISAGAIILDGRAVVSVDV
jgi:hypothetical protein